jgi:hypothetical protein
MTPLDRTGAKVSQVLPKGQLVVTRKWWSRRGVQDAAEGYGFLAPPEKREKRILLAASAIPDQRENGLRSTMKEKLWNSKAL